MQPSISKQGPSFTETPGEGLPIDFEVSVPLDDGRSLMFGGQWVDLDAVITEAHLFDGPDAPIASTNHNQTEELTELIVTFGSEARSVASVERNRL